MLGAERDDEAPGGPVTADPADPSADEDETVLHEHLERFQEVFEEAAIGMATMTLTGRMVRGNRSLARIVGHARGRAGGHVVRRPGRPGRRAECVPRCVRWSRTETT